MSVHCSQWCIFQKALRIKEKKYLRYKKKLEWRDRGTRKMLQANVKELKKQRSKACCVESSMKSVIQFKSENEAIKVENQRLREKQMKDIELLVNKNVDDPIAALKLELEKLEHQYFKQKEEIRWRDNVIQAQKDLNCR